VKKSESGALADAVLRCFESPNEMDCNLEIANVVDVIALSGRGITRSLADVAAATRDLAAAVRQHGEARGRAAD
jgi:hypothetical protein